MQRAGAERGARPAKEANVSVGDRVNQPEAAATGRAEPVALCGPWRRGDVAVIAAEQRLVALAVQPHQPFDLLVGDHEGNRAISFVTGWREAQEQARRRATEQQAARFLWIGTRGVLQQLQSFL